MGPEHVHQRRVEGDRNGDVADEAVSGDDSGFPRRGELRWAIDAEPVDGPDRDVARVVQELGKPGKVARFELLLEGA